MSIRSTFTAPKNYNTIAWTFMAIGLLSIIGLWVTSGSSTDPKEQARFWASLLQNSVFFLLIVNASMFFFCITTLAWGGWQMSFRRVPEAISAVVPVLGVIAAAILLSIVFGDNHTIYHWTDAEHVQHDEILSHKKGFLNKTFFSVVTILTVGLWSLLGWKMRQLSRSLDNEPLATLEERKKYIFKNTVWAALYIVVFSLTVMSSLPWLWLMSIDAHWYSTMYSWYTFASTFVSGMSLVAIYVIFLKNRGQLEYVTEEHLHDVGKFMFAFSVFWTYLWFSQFMLIWYANLPEEVVYYQIRWNYFKSLWVANLLINFCAPFLVLMTRDAKRKVQVIWLAGIIIICGHWLDVYLMVTPGTVGKGWSIGFTEVGTFIGYLGLFLFSTFRELSSAPLVPKNHPMLPESVHHHI